MGTQSFSLRQIVNKLNNDTDDGGLWLPDIQRHFVWSEKQICHLFDSILQGYPINTLLIWKTKEPVKRRKFIDRCAGDPKKMKLSEFFVKDDPDNPKSRHLVLDGQQRLQSLYIGLQGAYDGKELCLDIKSGEKVASDGAKYSFSFCLPEHIIFPKIRFRTIVYSDKDWSETVDDILKSAEEELPQEEKRRISNLVSRISQVFTNENGIFCQILDGVDKPHLYPPDEVAEIFIRVNSGGTTLSKSDLLFTLLVSAWDDVIKETEKILDEINDGGRFNFDRDFILKTCLTLLDQKAAYRVEKFRNPKVLKDIRENWANISDAIKKVIDYLTKDTFIRCSEALPSDQVLIPLVNYSYRFSTEWKNIKEEQKIAINDYLVRVLLTRSLSKSHADSIIDRMVDSIKAKFDKEKMFQAIRADGLSLAITEEQLLGMGYGSSQIHLLFNLWYDFNYRPRFNGNKPQVDHIFPQSKLAELRMPNAEGKMLLTKYRQPIRDQLANCMLLTAEENGFGDKSDKLPEEWFANKDESYLDKHLIPKDKELWKLDNFEKFIEARKQLIIKKFVYLLVSEEKSDSE